MRNSRINNREFADRAKSASPPVPEVLYSFKQLSEKGYVTFSRVHAYRLQKVGLFPAPVAVTPYRRAWPLSSILDWQNSRPPVPAKRPDARAK